MNDRNLAYYGRPGPLTRVPADTAELLEDLPSDVETLCEVVQGVMLHPDLCGLYAFEAPESRKQTEPELRAVARVLARIEELDSRPLRSTRPPERRVLGTCRSFATLLCGLLRFQGVAARARCGFARYFVPGKAEDHWVCEVWDTADLQWVSVDAQLDDVQRKAFGTSIDPLRVRADEFVSGGQAWRQCRAGEAAWSHFGLTAVGESGVWWVVSNFIRDVAALNKVELLPWDDWGLMLKDVGSDAYEMADEALLEALGPDDLTRLDQLAERTTREDSLEPIHAAFEKDDRFGVSGGVTSVRSGPVDLSTLEPSS